MSQKKKQHRSPRPLRVLATEALGVVRGGLNYTAIKVDYKPQSS
jgi:hypothetical protein